MAKSYTLWYVGVIILGLLFPLGGIILTLVAWYLVNKEDSSAAKKILMVGILFFIIGMVLGYYLMQQFGLA